MIDQNQTMGNPAYNMYNMYSGQSPQAMQKHMNVLSGEEIEKLTKATSKFSLQITSDERLRGICNHRTADGNGDAIVQDPVTGELKCQICGYTFRQVDPSMTATEIKGTISAVVDLLQTIKLMFVDMPVDAAREFFQIIPLMEKIPELFEIAAKNMTKHDVFGWNTKNPNMSAYSMFQNLTNIYGQGMFGQPTYQQPQPQPFMNAPQPQPMYGQPNFQPQPMGYGYGAYQPNMQSNGFMYTGAPAQATPTVQIPGPTVVEGTATPVEDAGETTVTQAVKA